MSCEVETGLAETNGCAVLWLLQPANPLATLSFVLSLPHTYTVFPSLSLSLCSVQNLQKKQFPLCEIRPQGPS